MNKIFFLLLFAIIQMAAYGQTTNDKRIVALEPQLNKLLKDWKAAGFAVAVVDKNKVIYAKGFGFRDLEKKLPVTTNTLFPIGSCTKAFTSSLIGVLDKEKLVEFDKPFYSYLPAINFYKPEMTQNITLRDMMSHRTGLPRHDFSWYLFPSSSRDSLLQRVKYMEPSAGIKDKWQYNNFMFLLQGLVAEKITGKSWEENIKTKFFAPLNMNRSNFFISDMTKDNDAAIGYYVKNDSLIKKLPYYEIGSMGPAGSINSSVMEMSNWVRTWINGGKFNDKEILHSSYIRDAISSQMIISPSLPDKEIPDVFFGNYGFGWFLTSYKGHYMAQHGGNIDGFSANTAFFPTDSIGIIVLSNQNGSVLPGIIRNMIADKVLGLNYTDWSGLRKKAADKAKEAEAEIKKTSSQKQGTKPTHALKDYTGLYSHPGYGAIEVYLNGDSLMASVPNKNLWLKHYHYNIFSPYEKDPEEGIDTSAASQLKFNFLMNLQGEINTISTDLEPSLKSLEFVKRPKEVAMTEASLQDYVGDFELMGTIIKVYSKGNTLYVHVPGQPDYELAAEGNDKFNLKILNGYSLQFIRDDAKNVISASFIQPNGTFTATKKK
ncbi:MAG: serine hydrolase [Flavisolibacter sp.]|nr:serine hydrolase [Flavisolibacter sp.]